MEKRSYLDLALFTGLGFYWAWLFLIFYSPVVAPQSESISIHVQDIWVWAAWAHAISLLLIAILANKIKTIANRSYTILAWTLVTSIGTAFLPLGDTLAASNPETAVVIDVIGAVVTGISTAVIVLMWAEFYARIGMRASLICMISTYILGSLLYFAVTSLPLGISTLCVVLLPIPCGICLWLVKKHEQDIPLPEKQSVRRGRFSLRIFIPVTATFLYALCGEILRAFATASGDSASFDAMGDLYIFGGVAGLVVLLLITFVMPKIAGKRTSEIGGIRTTLLIMAAGFLASAIFGVSFFVAYAIFGAAFLCCRSIVWAYLTYVTERVDISPLRVFGFTQASFACAVVIGTPIAQGLTSVVSLGLTQWSSIALVVIFLIFTSAVFIVNQRDIQDVWGLSPKKQASSQVDSASVLAQSGDLSFLKEEYGLSSRELDVAQLLAKGRSLPFIQSELHIAQGTAQTHLNHIYKKLDVHSRQEFLDLVERGSVGENKK